MVLVLRPSGGGGGGGGGSGGSGGGEEEEEEAAEGREREREAASQPAEDAFCHCSLVQSVGMCESWDALRGECRGRRMLNATTPTSILSPHRCVCLVRSLSLRLSV